MQNSKINLIFGILIGVLVLTTPLFTILWYQARQELRMRNNELGALQKEVEELKQKQAQEERIEGESETIDTSNWKTYLSEQHGFELRYPADLIVFSPSNLFFSFATSHRCASHDLSLAEDAFQNCQVVTVRVEPIKAIFDESTQVFVGGLVGERYSYVEYRSDGKGGSLIPIGQTGVQVEKDNLWYKLDISHHRSEAEAAYSFLDKILSTFEFKEIDTSSWKTYINKKYRYTIKFPPPYLISGGDVYEWSEGDDFSKADWISFSDPLQNRGRPSPYNNFVIRAYNPSEYLIVLPHIKLALKDFAQKIWELHRKEAIAGDLMERNVAGTPAYEFSIDRGFTDGNLSTILDSEHILILTAKDDFKFMIYFPSQHKIYKEILNTLQFTR